MTHSVVGEIPNETARKFLAPDWYKALTPAQLLAYIRHSYIWRSTGNTALDSPEQIKHRTQWDGGEDSFGVKFTPVWPRILKAIVSNDAIPGIWVAAHFSPIAISAHILPSAASGSIELRAVSPGSLCSTNSPKFYYDYLEFFPDAIKDSYETTCRSLRLRMLGLSVLPLTQTARYSCALFDEHYVIAPPFFRHAFATHAGAEDAADRYLWPAAFDYDAHQILYGGVPEWCITNKLLDAVETIRQHWSTV
jgi:hypothetical protein